MNWYEVVIPALLSTGLTAIEVQRQPESATSVNWQDISGQFQLVLLANAARPKLFLKVTQDPDYKGASREDYFLLRIFQSSDVGEPLAELRLYSRDARLQLAMADLTGDGIEELVTVHRVARGSGPRDELLHVWEWSNKPLARLLDVKVLGYGQDGKWWHQPSFIDLNDDGLLDLRLSPQGAWPPRGLRDRFHLMPPSADGYAYSPKTKKCEPVLGANSM